MADPPNAAQRLPPSKDPVVQSDPVYKKLKLYASFLPYEIESVKQMHDLLDFIMMRIVQVSQYRPRRGDASPFPFPRIGMA
jgi:hypothetical protein